VDKFFDGERLQRPRHARGQKLQLVHGRQELRVVADLLEAAYEQFHRFNG
jgi:hypothetical protein